MRKSIIGLAVLLASTGTAEAQRPSSSELARGKAIYAGVGNCYACHGTDGRGTPLAPNLADRQWLYDDGSLESIARLVRSGVDKPREHPTPMPAMGGAKLTAEEIQAVAGYVWSLSQALQDDQDSRAAVAAMRKALLDLASLQEMAFSGGKKYAKDVGALGFRPAAGVSVSILEATSEGWSASASHRELAGKSCVIYFGKASPPATAEGRRPARPAALTCDDGE